MKQYEIIAGTMQTFWMIKGIPTQKDYGVSKHADAHFFTKQDIKGWSSKPLDEITPDVIIKTLPYDLYSKKAGKKVSFQKNDYSQYTIRQENCKANEPYDVYIKDTDAVKHSKHEWKDFTSIKESNPTSIGTVAKEALVQSKAEEIKTVPALGHLANKDDDLSPFAKQILQKIELHKTIENKEIKDDVCLLTGYKKLPYIYECEQERSKLMRLVCKHPTEWRYTPKKADVLKLSEAQNKQVKALSWWDQASAIKELPQPQNVWHFHPVGFVGNLMGGGCLTVEMMLKVFNGKGASELKLKELVDELNNNLAEYKLDSCLRLAHFFAQVREETGANFRVEEGFNYKPSTLKSTFKYFRNNPAEATLYGRTSDHSANYKAIANRAYADRMDNGNIASEDGWKYRGRGLKMLTGHANYKDFTSKYKQVWSDEPKDFSVNPDLLLDMKYAVRSALFFWLQHKLYNIADTGKDGATVDKITAIINLHTNSYQNRRTHFNKIITKKVFKPCC